MHEAVVRVHGYFWGGLVVGPRSLAKCVSLTSSGGRITCSISDSNSRKNISNSSGNDGSGSRSNRSSGGRWWSSGQPAGLVFLRPEFVFRRPLRAHIS